MAWAGGSKALTVALVLAVGILVVAGGKNVSSGSGANVVAAAT